MKFKVGDIIIEPTTKWKEKISISVSINPEDIHKYTLSIKTFIKKELERELET